MTATAYWPAQFPRTNEREKGQFRTTLAGALHNVQRSLELFALDSGKDLSGLVISSNVTLGSTRPEDPGVAVWFTWDGLQVCIAVDRYQTIEGNLQAIHHIIEARRVELRHGTLALVRATFTGFLSLPAPASKKPWREVMGYGPQAEVTSTMLEERLRKLRGEKHPDRGGTTEAFNELMQAYEEARQEMR